MSVDRQPEPPGNLPTGDDVAGMAWWNALSQAKRLFWLTQAGGAAAGASAAAAWAAFKRADPAHEGHQDGDQEGKGHR